MGYAHGQLLKPQVQEIIPGFMDHVKSELDQYVKFLPKDIRGMIEQFGIDTVLDITYEMTRLVYHNSTDVLLQSARLLIAAKAVNILTFKVFLLILGNILQIISLRR